MWEDLKRFITRSDLLNRIIIANVGLFLLVNLLLAVCRLGDIQSMFTVSSAGIPVFRPTLWLSASSDFLSQLYRPWGVFTYMFLHEDIWHIFFNLLILFYIGRIFCNLLGERRFLPLYLLGGLAGWLFYALCYSVFPVFPPGDHPIMGASASVMAIVIATATYFPNFPIRLFLIGNVPLKYIAGFFLVLDLLALKGTSNLGGHLAHMGGAMYGFFFAYYLKNKGRDITLWFVPALQWFFTLFNRRKIRVVHHTKRTKKGPSHRTSVKKPQSDDHQKVIDAILDKISQSGYDSLSKEEKEILFKASKD